MHISKYNLKNKFALDLVFITVEIKLDKFSIFIHSSK